MAVCHFLAVDRHHLWLAGLALLLLAFLGLGFCFRLGFGFLCLNLGLLLFGRLFFLFSWHIVVVWGYVILHFFLPGIVKLFADGHTHTGTYKFRKKGVKGFMRK